jgi:fumarate reductase (CoM/CoB) subunit B
MNTAPDSVRPAKSKQSESVDARRLGQSEMLDSNDDRLNRLKIGDTVTAKIYRYDPSKDSAPRYETYQVPYVKWMRVLDVLNYLAEEKDIELAHRWFCGVKKCGTCAVRMNGREVLACWESAEPDMVIEPLRHLPVIRDLVVDREPYEQKVLQLKPWLQRNEPYRGFPEYLTDREMKLASYALDCISCMACFSACPVIDLGSTTDFAGPAPLVQMAQTALDPRDGMDRGKIAIEQGDVFSCVSCYKCEEVCPAEIPIVSAIIEPLKALAYASNGSGTKHQRAFLDIIKDRGRIDPSALVLRTQGLWAVFPLVRAIKLLLRGKINPVRTFFGSHIQTIQQVRALFEKMKGTNK